MTKCKTCQKQLGSSPDSIHTCTPVGRRQVFERRFHAGAKYNNQDIILFAITWYTESMCNIQINSKNEIWNVSNIDILFWPSNFFEVMFAKQWERYIYRNEREFTWSDEMPDRSIGWERPDYYKFWCSISKDKLQYLIDSLPNEDTTHEKQLQEI